MENMCVVQSPLNNYGILSRIQRNEAKATEAGNNGQ